MGNIMRKKTIVIISAVVVAVVAAFIIVRNYTKHNGVASDGAIYLSEDEIYKLDKGQHAKGTTNDGQEIEFWIE